MYPIAQRSAAQRTHAHRFRRAQPSPGRTAPRLPTRAPPHQGFGYSDNSQSQFAVALDHIKEFESKHVIFGKAVVLIVVIVVIVIVVIVIVVIIVVIVVGDER